MKLSLFSSILRGGGAIAAFLLVPLLLPAQTSFFTHYQPNQVVMSAAAWARHTDYLSSDITDDVKIISVGDVRTMQQDGKLRFLLPGLSDSLEAEAIRIEDDNRVGFMWYGELANQSGNLYLRYKDGQINGYISHDFVWYDIVHADGGYQFLVRRGLDVPIPSDCAVSNDTTSAPEPIGPGCKEENPNCPAIVSVLMVFDSTAKQFIESEYGSLGNYTMMNEQMVNTAFINSEIFNKKIRISYVIKDIPLDPDTLIVDKELQAIFDSTFTARELYKADLVFYVPYIYRPGIGGLFPPPRELSEFNFVNRGTGVAQAFLNFDLKIFAHEIGHAFGCLHNWPSTLGDHNFGGCEHGFRHIVVERLPTISQDGIIGGWMTIMSRPIWLRLSSGGPNPPVGFYSVKNNSILHYSNPNVLFLGEPTGRKTDNGAYNAEHIRKTACLVADYYPTQEFDVIVNYAPSGNCTAPTVFTAVINVPDEGRPGVGPYTVSWYWNTTGIFEPDSINATFLGNGLVLTLQEYPACPVFWIKCKVVSSDGVTINQMFRIVIRSDSPIADCFCGDALPRQKVQNHFREESNPSPNPIRTGQLLTLPTGTEQVDLIGLNGHVIVSQSALSKGTLFIPEYLDSGIYLLKAKFQHRTQTFKLFILKN